MFKRLGRQIYATVLDVPRTVDPNFDQAKKNFLQLEQILLELRKEIQHYLTILRSLTHASQSIVQSILPLFRIQPAESALHPYTPVVSDLLNSHSLSMNSLKIQQAQQLLQQTLVVKIDELLTKFEFFKLRISAREEKLEELDFLIAKIAGEKRRGAAVAEEREEQALGLSKSYNEMNFNLTLELKNYWDGRLDILGPLLLDFFNAEKYFAFLWGAQIFNTNQAVERENLPKVTWEETLLYLQSVDVAHTKDFRPSINTLAKEKLLKESGHPINIADNNVTSINSNSFGGSSGSVNPVSAVTAIPGKRNSIIDTSSASTLLTLQQGGNSSAGIGSAAAISADPNATAAAAVLLVSPNKQQFSGSAQLAANLSAASAAQFDPSSLENEVERAAVFTHHELPSVEKSKADRLEHNQAITAGLNLTSRPILPVRTHPAQKLALEQPKPLPLTLAGNTSFGSLHNSVGSVIDSNNNSRRNSVSRSTTGFEGLGNAQPNAWSQDKSQQPSTQKNSEEKSDNAIVDNEKTENSEATEKPLEQEGTIVAAATEIPSNLTNKDENAIELS
jgi:hypothetical protein